MSLIRIIFLRVSFLISLILSGCASTSPNTNPKDPYEGFNRSMYQFNDTLDRAVLKPVAQGYRAVMPDPGQKMVHNFFSNIDDIFVTGNDLLQLKFHQAASDFTRVWVNTIFGVFGLFDVAHKLEKHNEDFGQTLGYWGVSSGPYLVLPFLGPSSVRDGAGLATDSYFGVIENLDDIPVRNSLWVTNKVNLRAELLDSEKIIEGTVVDRYSFIRDAYMMHRQSLVYDGDPPRVKYDDEDE
ncbi:MAG TPA: VacJ family lipoprotein [Gallionellaceae bacterium]|nr:VacJ family lipoprotein [Gallionellaceae bacterium]